MQLGILAGVSVGLSRTGINRVVSHGLLGPSVYPQDPSMLPDFLAVPSLSFCYLKTGDFLYTPGGTIMVEKCVSDDCYSFRRVWVPFVIVSTNKLKDVLNQLPTNQFSC